MCKEAQEVFDLCAVKVIYSDMVCSVLSESGADRGRKWCALWEG